MLQSIFEDATKKTKELKQDEGKYTEMLEGLILEVRTLLVLITSLRSLIPPC